MIPSPEGSTLKSQGHRARAQDPRAPGGQGARGPGGQGINARMGIKIRRGLWPHGV